MADLADRRGRRPACRRAWSIWGGWTPGCTSPAPIRSPARRQAPIRCQARPALESRRRGDHAALPAGRQADEGERRRLHRDDGLGPGRDRDGGRLGRALRRDQGGDHGVHPQPGPEPGPMVSVNALAPGWIKTAWGEAASAPGKNACSGETPMHGWGTPEDVRPRRPLPGGPGGRIPDRADNQGQWWNIRARAARDCTPRILRRDPDPHAGSAAISCSSPAGWPSSRSARCSMTSPRGGVRGRGHRPADLRRRADDPAMGRSAPRRPRRDRSASCSRDTAAATWRRSRKGPGIPSSSARRPRATCLVTSARTTERGRYGAFDIEILAEINHAPAARSRHCSSRPAGIATRAPM